MRKSYYSWHGGWCDQGIL